MEGSGEGIAGCVVHVDVHGGCVMLWVGASTRSLVVHKLLKYMYIWNPVTNKQTDKHSTLQHPGGACSSSPQQAHAKLSV